MLYVEPDADCAGAAGDAKVTAAAAAAASKTERFKGILLELVAGHPYQRSPEAASLLRV
jgi:hypothetical protein